MSPAPDSKSRFSSRVENYVKYRPGYPPAVIEKLRADCGLAPASVVADIGSGTGLFALLFLEAGCQVFGVEPNAEMRAAGERLLAAYPNFTSVDGSAEVTGLPDASVDFAAAAQAFHWFDAAAASREFLRILKPDGWVVLAWNERRSGSTPLARDYEALLETYSVDYQQVKHQNVSSSPEAIPNLFGGPFASAHFDNYQVFDFDGLRGRLLSSSYSPQPGHPSYEPMLAGLRRIFDTHQRGGRVTFEYDTELYYGHLARVD